MEVARTGSVEHQHAALCPRDEVAVAWAFEGAFEVALELSVNILEAGRHLDAAADAKGEAVRLARTVICAGEWWEACVTRSAHEQGR